MDIRYLRRIIDLCVSKNVIQRRPAMSTLSIAKYFPFPRVRIIDQSVYWGASQAQIKAVPDQRFTPICHICGHPSGHIHSWEQRTVRDLNLASARVWLHCQYRKILCLQCQRILIEDLELFHPYLRVTQRLAQYIHALCKVMTVKEVSQHLGLAWKTVKNIDKLFLERQYGQPNFEGLKILAIDEISIRRGHRYLTIVLDYLTGRVVWIGKHRKARTLSRFFNQMTPEQRKALEAIVMDMWDPYIKAVQKKVPHVKIVFDLFHVVAQFSRVIDQVRNSEYRKASQENKEVFKGAKYLLLKNRSNVRRKKERQQLKELLRLNETINTVMILKDQLKHIWSYRSRTWANKALDEWCSLARALRQRTVTKFTKMLDHYRYGILNHCDYPIHTGILEGVNNKIKVIKRKAYGFQDLHYFSLKIIQAFAN
jgi:transposase